MSALLDHIDTVVRPALRAYAVAEEDFTFAQIAAKYLPVDVESERTKARRAARTATGELHHLSDFALHNPPPAFARVEEVRDAIRARTFFLRTPSVPIPDDVDLLMNVADAFKHFKLTKRPNAAIHGADDVATISTGWGTAQRGEGKFGGVSQVMVTQKNGDKRALSSVLQNVFDAWLTLLDQPLPKINEF